MKDELACRQPFDDAHGSRNVPALAHAPRDDRISIDVVDSPAVVDAFPFRLMLAAMLGWLDRRQQDTVAYLIEENRILRSNC